MSAETFFSDQQKEEIRKAIAVAEKKTSGEIRVHIEEECKEEVVHRAEKVFVMLEMHKTELRNGVLFYLAINSRVFAIYGDKGIHEKVSLKFWDEASAMMERQFKEGKFTEGLIAGIQKAGDQLSAHFPRKDNDKNELSDEISFT
jgi:uncharacterized membrane protein